MTIHLSVVVLGGTGHVTLDIGHIYVCLMEIHILEKFNRAAPFCYFAVFIFVCIYFFISLLRSVIMNKKNTVTVCVNKHVYIIKINQIMYPK